MMNDTVREELETKITSNSGGLSVRALETEAPPPAFLKQRNESAAVGEQEAADAPERQSKQVTRSLTSDLSPKHTSPTLVDFQAKAPTLPDWRLQLQNAVRQRGTKQAAVTTEVGARSPGPSAAPSAPLRMEIDSVARSKDTSHPKLESAIKRIEDSRNAFMPVRHARQADENFGDPVLKKFPFEVVTTNSAASSNRAAVEQTPISKPKLVSALRIEKKPYDTNKLPPLPLVGTDQKPKAGSVGILIDDEISVERTRQAELTPALPALALHEIEPQASIFEGTVQEEADDLAPFSMRFGSGLFDFILAAFGTLIILSPFLVAGGTWVSISGVLTMTSTFALFMFLYLTASLAFWGKTFGMRIFSLELIDADANVYPTLHQSAVSSAVYILSLAVGGLGFLTVFFNPEKRAVHDLVSGTLLIREI
jgi:uncharacterized RDD family membrane protein YckC